MSKAFVKESDDDDDDDLGPEAVSLPAGVDELDVLEVIYPEA
jgi:hypothetical protein